MLRPRSLHRSIQAFALALLGAAALAPAAAATATQLHRAPLKLFALTDDGRLLVLREHRASRAEVIARVYGLQTDTALVGIDHRPATGELYGLGNAGGVYVIDTRTGLAILKSRLDKALDGTVFGVDFNPTVDRLRIVSDTGQNLRANVDTGATLVDTALNFPGPSPAAPTTPASGVTGAAYTNNDADPTTATTLYGLDTVNDQVAIQSPPNQGALAATGKLGLDVGSQVGFDVYSRVDDGTTRSVRALASLVVDGRARLYRIDLVTGRADWRSSFPKGVNVIDVAIPLEQR